MCLLCTGGSTLVLVSLLDETALDEAVRHVHDGVIDAAWLDVQHLQHASVHQLRLAVEGWQHHSRRFAAETRYEPQQPVGRLCPRRAVALRLKLV